MEPGPVGEQTKARLSHRAQTACKKPSQRNGRCLFGARVVPFVSGTGGGRTARVELAFRALARRERGAGGAGVKWKLLGFPSLRLFARLSVIASAFAMILVGICGLKLSCLFGGQAASSPKNTWKCLLLLNGILLHRP